MASFQRNSIVPYMEGCLEKRLRPKFCNWWRKFWFVLNGKTLLCFRNREESEMLRNIPRKEFLNFTKVHAVRPLHNSPNRFSFEIITRKSTIVLAAINQEIRKKWIESFQNALQLSIISSPIQGKPCANVDNKHLFFGNREYSLSQPNLLFSACKTGTGIQRHYSVRQRRKTMVASVDLNDAPKQDPENFGGSMVLETRRIPNRCLDLAQSIFGDREHSPYRCTAVDFFMSEQNVNWPSLSMDIQDEIFKEVVHQHEEMKRMLVNQVKETGVSEMSTQTEFSDESCCDDDNDDEPVVEDQCCQCDEMANGEYLYCECECLSK